MRRDPNNPSFLFQWALAVFMVIILLLILGLWIDLVNESIIWALFIFFMVPVIQFMITPICTITQLYTYYSPMVVAFGKTQTVLDLHNGTSYDYLLKMRGVRPGIMWKKRMLRYYLEALLEIIKEIESGELSEQATIRGSSYFISERTAQKLGFGTYGTSVAERINILLNYVDLLWMYSLSEGKLIFPSLTNIKTVRIKGHELVQQKGHIVQLHDYLSR